MGGHVDDNQSDSQELASHYLLRVSRELKEREDRVVHIDAEISRIDFRLRELSNQRALRRGDTAVVVAGEAYRSSLQNKVTRLRQQRAEAVEQVKAARERKRMIEDEIQQSESLPGIEER